QILGEALSNMAVKDLKNLETKLERGISKIHSKKNKLLFAEIRLHAEEVSNNCGIGVLKFNIPALNRDGWLKFDELGKEILSIALPAALALAANPLTSLIDTVFVGHI
ncbi:hypothetical protein S83_004659, partial [Arachis hypogaea]